MAKKVYIVDFDANNKPYFRTLDEMEKKTNQSTRKIDDSFKKIGAGIATYFGGREILNFAKDSILLASKLQGVKSAFDRLKSSENTLERLRKATRGTVSDLQLMQAAVKADNFKIPLDLLARGLEFANKRAIQTGESVEYMVDSFITGVARKSIPILDNLGISQVTLNQEIAKTGDFYQAIGNIVAQENLKMSSSIDNTAEAMQRLNATIENNRTELSSKLLPLWGNFLGISNELLSSWDTLGSLLTGNFINQYSKAVLRQNQYAGGSGGALTPYNYNDLLKQGDQSLLSFFNNRKPLPPQKGGKQIPMIRGRKMDNPQRYLESVLSGAGTRGMELGGYNPLTNFSAEMTETVVPELKLEFENIGDSFVNKFSETENIANQIGRIFNVSADSFVGKLMQAFDVGSSILSVISSVASLASGGGITSLLGLAEGGTVINKGGKLSYAPIPKFARGGSYIVPPGYANDSGLIRVQSGERLDVTPTSKVPQLGQMLSEIKSAIMAGNMNNSRKGSQPIIIHNVMDGQVVSTNVTRHQNRMAKAGKNFGDLT